MQSDLKEVLMNSQQDIKIKSRYSQSEKTQYVSDLPSETKQQFKDETDVNYILKRYTKTGILSHVNEIEARFGDWSDVSDYQDAMNRVLNAKEEFLKLPSIVREKCRNNPMEFLDYIRDDKNRAEAESLGLLEKRDISESRASKGDASALKEDSTAPAGE